VEFPDKLKRAIADAALKAIGKSAYHRVRCVADRVRAKVFDFARFEYFMRRAEVLMNTSPQFKLLLVEAINEEKAACAANAPESEPRFGGWCSVPLHYFETAARESKLHSDGSFIDQPRSNAIGAGT
jgi:hypothetical protein